jgi:hypothetical protein
MIGYSICFALSSLEYVLNILWMTRTSEEHLHFKQFYVSSRPYLGTLINQNWIIIIIIIIITTTATKIWVFCAGT